MEFSCESIGTTRIKPRTDPETRDVRSPNRFAKKRFFAKISLFEIVLFVKKKISNSLQREIGFK